MKKNKHPFLLCFVQITLLICITQCICFADKTSDVQLLRTSLKDKQLQDALAQLKTLVTEYPKDAASFVIDDQTKELWGSNITDAILVIKQVADSLPASNGFTLKIALLDCYKNLEDWKNAFSLIEKMKTDYPDQKWACHNFAAICYYNQGKNYDTAFAEAKKAVDSFNCPSDEKALLEKVLSCYSSDKTAIRAVYAIIRHSPGNTDLKKAHLYSWAAQVCRIAGRPTEAIPVFKKAMQLCSASDKSMKRSMITSIIGCYKEAGMNREAAEFEASIRKDCADDVAFCEQQRLAHLYLDSKEYDKAIEICKQILHKADGFNAVDALTVLAECMYPLGRGKEAVEFQNKYYAAHPGNEMAAAWVKAQTAYYAERDFAKADQELKKIIKDYPNGSTLNAARELLASNNLFHLNKPEDAKKIYEELISDGADSADIRFHLSYCSYIKKDYKTAVESFKYVYDNFLKTKYGISALYMMGDCYANLGEIDTAKSTFKTILNDYPAANVAADAQRRLGRLIESEENKIDNIEEDKDKESEEEDKI